jgi:thioredoxin 2
MEITCPACGARNRIPPSRAGEPARCGRCHRPLPSTAPAAAPVTVSDADFDRVVLGASTPVLVDAWADWCQPCHMLAPTIDALARDYAGRVLVAKLDVDANPATAGRFGIRSIPTVLVFRDGRLVDRITGVQPRGAFDAALLPLVA